MSELVCSRSIERRERAFRLNLIKNMHVFDQFADQFARLPMYFMTFHGQESIDKVINVRPNLLSLSNAPIENLFFF